MPILFAPSASQISDVTLTSPTGYYGSTATFIVSTQGYNNGDSIYYSTTGSGIVQTTGTITVSNYLGDLGKANIPITTIRTTSTTAVITATFYNGSTPVNLTYGVSSLLSSLAIPDPFFTATTLLLSAAGPGPTALTDLSGTTSSIFVANSATIRSFIPFTTPGVSSSMFFNGNTDHLSIPANSGLTFGTGDFTIEFWVNPGASSRQDWIDFDNGSSQRLLILYNSNIIFSSGGVDRITGPTITLGTWIHIAVVRISGSTRLYVNGSQSGITYTDARDYPAQLLTIGKDNAGSTRITGYMSNLRVVKGLGVYTGAFTPPSNPLQTTQAAGTNIAAITTQTVLLLLQAPLATNNTSFLDSASTNTVISAGGTPAQGTFSPFWPYATTFNGSNQYLLANSSILDLATGAPNWTVECWFYLNNVSTQQCIFWKGGTSGSVNSSYSFALTNASGQWVVGDGGAGGAVVNIAASFAANTWYHFALVRNGSTLTSYTNGVQSGTASAPTMSNTGNDKLTLGSSVADGSTRYLSGYIANFRITKGLALYTATFTPPSISSLLLATANTVMLTCQGPAPADYSTYTNTVTSVGTAGTRPISTTTFLNSVYSTSTIGGSMYFDGTTVVSTTSTSGLHTLGSNDFTAECWFYTSTVSGNGQIIGFRSATLSFAPFILWNASGSISIYSSGTGASWNIANAATAGTVIFNQWNHLAVVRTVNTMTVYLNGTSTYSVSVSGVTFAQVGWPLQIGASGAGGGDPYTGFISNVRLVNGYAIYPFASRFAPSLRPLTASLTGTSLVLAGNNSGIYDATGNNAVLTGSTASLTTSIVKFGSNSIQFNGTSYLKVTGSTNTNFSVGTGDFTVECWIYPTAATWTSGNFYIWDCGMTLQYYQNQLSFYNTTIGVGSSLYASTKTLSSSTWSHLAIARQGGTTRMFVNGTLITSASDGFSIVPSPLYIGAASNLTLPFQGYISDFRFTKLARYTASFTSATTYLPLI